MIFDRLVDSIIWMVKKNIVEKIVFFKYYIDLYYINVPEDKILFYGSLLNSTKYLVNQNE